MPTCFLFFTGENLPKKTVKLVRHPVRRDKVLETEVKAGPCRRHSTQNQM